MKLKNSTSVTLIELLMTVTLIGLLILAIHSMETYAKIQLSASDRYAQLQNELSFVLADMSRYIVRATGFQGDLGIVDTGTALRVRVDVNNTPGDLGDDTSICYRRSGNRIQRFIDGGLTCSGSGGWEDIVTRDIILDGTPPDPEGFNFQVLDNGTGIDITLRSRFDVNQAHSIINPALDMRIRVYSRSASDSM